jgi:hypothetical protein
MITMPTKRPGSASEKPQPRRNLSIELSEQSWRKVQDFMSAHPQFKQRYLLERLVEEWSELPEDQRRNILLKPVTHTRRATA